MSKILDTLRRRDPPHGTPTKEERRELERRGLHEQAELPPAASDDALPTDAPFVEVGAGIEMTTSATPLSVAGPKTSCETPPGTITFRPVEAASAGTDSEIADVLAIWRSPASGLAERYRKAAKALAAAMQSVSARALALTAVGELPHRTCLAVNLAVALAEHCRQQVLLIDADGKNRRLAKLLNLPSAPGWTDMLAGLIPDQAIQATDWPRLHLIAGGNRLAAVHPAIHGERARSLVRDLAARYDLALLFTPAWTDLTGPSSLIYSGDAVCLLTAQESASESADLPRQRLLEERGISVVGQLVFRG
jgi:hypothetical protein